jgi:hypothetical protein
VKTGFTDVAHELQAIHPRHLEVANNNVHGLAVFRQDVECFLAVARGIHVSRIERAQELDERVSLKIVVFND